MNEDNSNADLDEFKFNVRKPKDCGKKFNPNTKPDQVKYESMSSMEKMFCISGIPSRVKFLVPP